MQSLLKQMLERLPEGGVSIPGGRGSHMEILETTTGLVWMSAEND